MSEIVLWPEYPERRRSARGKPKPLTSIERTCRVCGASFIGLAPGKTGERGIWTPELRWYCSAECAGTLDAPSRGRSGSSRA